MPSMPRFPAAALLLLAVAPALCLAQASSTAARSHSTTATRPASAAHAATDRTSPGPAPFTTPPDSSATANPPCTGGPCDYQQPHISIATPAPAPAPWPLQDRIRWAAEILLLLIAYPSILLALSLLRKIERQTRYAESTAQAAAEAAKAAMLYAEHQASADRPWILATAEPTPGVANSFSVVATNRGRSPARIVALSEGLSVVRDEADLPSAPVFKGDSRTPFEPIVLLPGESASIRTFIRDEVKSVCENPEQVQRVEDWDERIYLYGNVVYNDLVAPREERRETGWCCWYIHGRQKSGMIMAGPPEYNRHT